MLPDMAALLQYLWTVDVTTAYHGRTRLQIALAILILSYTGLRPGSVVRRADIHPSTTKGHIPPGGHIPPPGLRYGDVEIWAIADDDCPDRIELTAKATFLQQKTGEEQSWYV